MGLEFHPDHELFVSDLLGLVTEGKSWDQSLQHGRGKHARIWREIFQVARRRVLEYPIRFEWTPAHRDPDS
eukprot:8859080-Pyramimonas_sp.AAC.1